MRRLEECAARSEVVSTAARSRGLDVSEPETCAEARPCPFCGGDEILVRRVAVSRGYLVWLVCRKCGACIRGQSSPVVAVQRWNGRVSR